LRNLIASASDFRAAGNGHILEPVAIERDGGPWLVIEAMPLSAFGTELFGAFRTMLVITDLSRPIVPRERVLRLAFGLTPAEARLAATVAGGEGVDAAAAALGIARETARSQLKVVFSKTGTANQAQLVALISRISANPA
jgi:DNA-binding CsgD family transcriptional regulator